MTVPPITSPLLPRATSRMATARYAIPNTSAYTWTMPHVRPAGTVAETMRFAPCLYLPVAWLATGTYVGSSPADQLEADGAYHVPRGRHDSGQARARRHGWLRRRQYVRLSRRRVRAAHSRCCLR